MKIFHPAIKKIDYRLGYTLTFLSGTLTLTRNWYDVILGRLGVKRRPIITFRNGLKFYYEKNRFISDVFTDQEYKILNVTGREVVDVGAFNADSSLYFALNGAHHVYAFEPMPRTFNMAKENVSLNRFNNISLFNEAVGARDGLFSIDPNVDSHLGSSPKNSDKGFPIQIPIISLEHIVQNLELHDPVLKLDCEGAEFSIMLETPRQALSVFSEIVLEYHREPSMIVDRLEELGYVVSMVKDHGSEGRGLIYAQKKTG